MAKNPVGIGCFLGWSHNNGPRPCVVGYGSQSTLPSGASNNPRDCEIPCNESPQLRPVLLWVAEGVELGHSRFVVFKCSKLLTHRSFRTSTLQVCSDQPSYIRWGRYCARLNGKPDLVELVEFQCDVALGTR